MLLKLAKEYNTLYFYHTETSGPLQMNQNRFLNFLFSNYASKHGMVFSFTHDFVHAISSICNTFPDIFPLFVGKLLLCNFL